MPKKSLGQNFLIDHNIAKKISNTIPNFKEYNLIEVGPGKGFLTDYLIEKKPKKIFLIEKDKNLYQNLKIKYKKNKNIEIFNYDALKTKLFFEISQPKIIVSNLPYNISIKLITNWLPSINNFIGFYLMIQKEVAERFKYTKSEKLNRLNLLTYLLSDFKKEFNVSNNVFYPKPKVLSSFVSFKPNIKVKIDPVKFANFTKILFFSKRKKIINNLIRKNKYKKIINDKKKLNVDISKRAEDLNFDDIIYLFSIFN